MVQLDFNWVPITKKVQKEAERNKKIKEGYVEFQGEWVTIAEKIIRTAPAPEKKSVAQNIVINKNDNRRVYNVTHNHDHSVHQKTVNENKHLHFDEKELKNLPLDDKDLKRFPKNPAQTQKKLTGEQLRQLPLHDKNPPGLPRPDHLD